MDHRCAKIHRVCRSSLAAEAHAAVSACDQALWLQILLTEITIGECDVRRFSPPTEFPLQNPFPDAPTNEQVTRDLIPESRRRTAANYFTDEIVHTFEMQQQNETLFDIRILNCGTNVETEDNWLFLPILLADSCSLYTAILRIQPRSEDKCAKIILNYLRDLQALLRISYIDATTNLADVETKHAGSLDILAKFLFSGLFTLSFVGGRQVGEMGKNAKTVRADRKKRES